MCCGETRILETMSKGNVTMDAGLCVVAAPLLTLADRIPFTFLYS